MKQKIKSVVGLLLTFAIILSIAPVTVFAEGDILDYLTYEINNGEVTITDCDTSISGDVTIPDTIEGYPVTVIGNNVFRYCPNITNLVIPEGVISIGDCYFCDSLETLTLPASLTEIGGTFRGCPSLKKVIIMQFFQKIIEFLKNLFMH